MKRHPFSAVMAIVLLLLVVPTLVGNGIHARQPSLSTAEKSSPGDYTVYVLDKGEWREAGNVSSDNFLLDGEIDLSNSPVKTLELTIRIKPATVSETTFRFLLENRLNLSGLSPQGWNNRCQGVHRG